jgi:hypothetical protein
MTDEILFQILLALIGLMIALNLTRADKKQKPS